MGGSFWGGVAGDAMIGGGIGKYRPGGCACGRNTCDKFARCYEGQRLYDGIYTVMARAADL